MVFLVAEVYIHWVRLKQQIRTCLGSSLDPSGESCDDGKGVLRSGPGMVFSSSVKQPIPFQAK